MERRREDSGREIAVSAGGVAAATFASRLLGLARDTVIAATFTSFQTDCFFMAFTIPNVLRRILGEGSLNAAVVPVYASMCETKDARSVRRFLAALWGTAGLLLALVSIAGVIGSPVIVRLYAWGFASVAEKFNLTNNLNRIMFPYIFFTGLVAISSGILNVHRKFFTPALSPAIWNAAMIAAALTLPALFLSRGIDTVYVLAVGVMAGGLIQLVYQLLLQGRTGTLPFPSVSFRDEGLREVWRLMIPLLAGFGVYQVDVLLSRLFASFLPEGSVSYLYYGNRLIDFPQGVIFLALGTASLPMMSKLMAKGDLARLKEAYGSTLSLTFFISIPATVGLIAMARPIVSIIFFRGSFTPAMFEPTWMALAWMSFGVLGTAVVRVTTPVFYAFKDTRTPVIVGAVNLAVYVACCLALMFPFKHLGLAAALSIAPITQSIQLMLHLRKKTRGIQAGRIAAGVVKYSLASAGMAAFMLALCTLGRWERGGNDLKNIGVAAAAGCGGVGIYLLLAWLLRVEEIKLLRLRRQP